MDWEGGSDRPDEYGPGSDLVLSLFAMAILIVAIVGIAYNIEKRKSIGDEKGGSIAKLVELEGENEKLKGRLEEALADAEIKGKKIAALEKKDAEGLYIPIIERKGFLPFRLGSAELTEEGKQSIVDKIRDRLPDLLEEIRKKGANMLLVEGHASPEPLQRGCAAAAAIQGCVWVQRRPERAPGGLSGTGPMGTGVEGGDGNLDLSVLRATAVAHLLAQRGVPYPCVTVLGHGRNRSTTVSGVYRTQGSRGIEQWDQWVLSLPRNSPEWLSLTEKTIEERRVLIRIAEDKSSQCTAKDLANALQRMQ
jgi:outer membrane protein OmpA-like peptidoglycan-associated protein